MTIVRDFAENIQSDGDLIVSGDLQVSGTTTTVNSTTVEIGDKNIVLGANATANSQNDGGGISILLPDPSPDEFATFTHTGTTWNLSDSLSIDSGNLNIVSGNFQIAGTTVIDSSTNITTTGLTVNAGNSASSTPLNIIGSNSSYTSAAIKNTGTGDAILWFDGSNGDLADGDYASIRQANTGLHLVLKTEASGGSILLQPAGATALTLDTSQNATFAGTADVGGTIRSTGISSPTSGKGIELRYTASDQGSIISYDRSASSYKPLIFQGSILKLQIDSTDKLTIGSTGNATFAGTIDSGAITSSGAISARDDYNTSTQGGAQLTLYDNTTDALNMKFGVDTAIGSSGGGSIQVTETSVSNDRDLKLNPYGGKVSVGVAVGTTLTNTFTVEGTSYTSGDATFAGDVTVDGDLIYSTTKIPGTYSDHWKTTKYVRVGAATVGAGNTGNTWVHLFTISNSSTYDKVHFIAKIGAFDDIAKGTEIIEGFYENSNTSQENHTIYWRRGGAGATYLFNEIRSIRSSSSGLSNTYNVYAQITANWIDYFTVDFEYWVQSPSGSTVSFPSTDFTASAPSAGSDDRSLTARRDYFNNITSDTLSTDNVSISGNGVLTFGDKTFNGYDIVVGNQTTARAMVFAPYSTIGTRYSNWDTWIGQNTRPPIGTQNSGVELASSYIAGGASGLNVEFQQLAFYTWTPSELTGLAESDPLTLGTPKFLVDVDGDAWFGGSIQPGASLLFDRGSGTADNIIRAANFPSAGYTSTTNKAWIEYSAAGGHHFVVNSDGSSGGAANGSDHFTIWQGAIDGDELFRVTNVGKTTQRNAAQDIEIGGNEFIQKRAGRVQGIGTYALFTNGVTNTQSSGTVEIQAIYGTPSGSAIWKYKISGNRATPALIYSETTGYSGATPTLAWNGADLEVSNSDSSTYYSVVLELHNIGIGWSATFGNFPGFIS